MPNSFPPVPVIVLNHLVTGLSVTWSCNVGYTKLVIAGLLFTHFCVAFSTNSD